MREVPGDCFTIEVSGRPFGVGTETGVPSTVTKGPYVVRDLYPDDLPVTPIMTYE